MDNPVVIASGEVVNFPVASDHPLAKYQQLQDVSEVDNHRDLAVVRALTASNPNLSTAQTASAVTGILRSSMVSKILAVNLPDLTVQKGGTLVLGGPINRLSANNVTIEGTVIVHGSLNLTCKQLGGGSPFAEQLRPGEQVEKRMEKLG